MADIIEPRPAARAGRPAKYPWAEWADGQCRLLRRGEDFDISLDSMRQMVYQKARRLDMRASVGFEGPVGAYTGLRVQFQAA